MKELQRKGRYTGAIRKGFAESRRRDSAKG